MMVWRGDVQEDVCRLDICVHDSIVVQEFQAGDEIVCDPGKEIDDFNVASDFSHLFEAIAEVFKRASDYCFEDERVVASVQAVKGYDVRV